MRRHQNPPHGGRREPVVAPYAKQPAEEQRPKASLHRACRELGVRVEERVAEPRDALEHRAQLGMQHRDESPQCRDARVKVRDLRGGLDQLVQLARQQRRFVERLEVSQQQRPGHGRRAFVQDRLKNVFAP
eukprot:Amastigsp_a851855_7.p2 type:complete len:131 gc:universal Amastigsp_a851855_7:348-740(+)